MRKFWSIVPGCCENHFELAVKQSSFTLLPPYARGQVNQAASLLAPHTNTRQTDAHTLRTIFLSLLPEPVLGSGHEKQRLTFPWYAH